MFGCDYGKQMCIWARACLSIQSVCVCVCLCMVNNVSMHINCMLKPSHVCLRVPDSLTVRQIFIVPVPVFQIGWHSC